VNLQTDAFESVLWYFNGISQFAFTGLILDLFQEIEILNIYFKSSFLISL